MFTACVQLFLIWRVFFFFRKKNELEGLLRQLEGAAGDHKLLLEGQRKEVMSLSEALAKQQVCMF